ncbi:MAG: bifunctional alpha,alpha-trehalose-phosphate synthase (UDP-forming)/trehalose-phosphatase [Dehalococcoidia bacterium]
MRLVIVSNRLPFRVKVDRGEITIQSSDGGLASGMRTYLDVLGASPNDFSDHVWIGWPGAPIDGAAERERLRRQARDDFNAYPVFLSQEQIDSFYFGFCNSTIWPLFHYFASQAVFEDQQWEEYKAINELFRTAVLEVVRPDDIVWIHDYQLMLLPAMLRERFPRLAIGFFLHIPFPSVDVFRLLPNEWRRAILEGMLGADLVGFHNESYTDNFLESAERILGIEESDGKLHVENRIVQASAYPMGIDFRRFEDATREPAVERERQALLKQLEDRRIILSLDRLDYTKGIVNRLNAFRTFLAENPSWHGKIVLVLVVIPSRDAVANYADLKIQIEQLVSRINGEFGSLAWTPILYQYRTVPFEDLIALYSVADVALITPLRDGMNLVSKEYIASRSDNSGVLILSEMAGAAGELTGAIIVNPNDEHEVAQAIQRALAMPTEEQAIRNANMRRHIQENDVVRWGSTFVAGLIAARKDAEVLQLAEQDFQPSAVLLDAYRAAKKRLLFLDYDGTLVPFADTPGRAWPDGELLRILANLAADQRNDVVIVSGRSRHDLEYWFGELDLSLAAEHGLWIRERGRDWRAMAPMADHWREIVRPVLTRYVERLPGTFVEEKEGALVWHYRLAEPDAADRLVNELSAELLALAAEHRFQVTLATKVVEITTAGIHKGNAGLHFLTQGDWDFIVALGDDWPDEALFGVLPQHAFTIRVGNAVKGDQHRLRDFTEARALLETMIDASRTDPDVALNGAEAPSQPLSAQILVVDDDPAVLSGLRRALALEGYDVTTAPDGDAAIGLVGQVSPDVIVLDVMMPGMSGLEVCQRLRDNGVITPILILSARDTLPDRIAGLDRGADDYLVKPFAIDELLARVRALLRRSQRVSDSALEYLGLAIDPKSHEARRGGETLKLSPREFELLRLFLRNPRRVLTREQVSQHVWGPEGEGDPSHVDNAIKELRKKLEADQHPRLIQTVRGYGYALREE